MTEADKETLKVVPIMQICVPLEDWEKPEKAVVFEPQDRKILNNEKLALKILCLAIKAVINHNKKKEKKSNIITFPTKIFKPH